MVILKNDTEILFNHEFVNSYLKCKEPDCDIYSSEGIKFSIHKEVLYSAKLMKNILLNSNNFCCKSIEIFCPCTEDELESMVEFFYTGIISYNNYTDINKFVDNLTKLFGFSDNLFSFENYNSESKEDMNIENKSVFENEDERNDKPPSFVKLEALDSDPLSCNDIKNSGTVMPNEYYTPSE